MNDDKCALCFRAVETTKHHLIPRQKKGKDGPTVPLCEACHNQLHALFTNGELKRDFNTIEKLMADSRVQNYLDWIQKHPNTVRLQFSGRGGFHK